MIRSLCATACLVIAVHAMAETIRLSEPVQVTETYEVFGSPMSDTAEGMTLAELFTRESELNGSEIRVTTRVGKVCQKKGCFFVAYEGDKSARISFADYSFFIPTDSGGKDVTLVGTFERTEVTGEQAKHFAQDLGDDAGQADPSEFEYSIVATSVLIPTSH